MRHLILLRHAKTESVSAAGDDLSRGLTERGRRDAALMARALAKAGLSPDHVLLSPARRAAETWDEMVDAFPDARAAIANGLYLAGVEQLQAAVDAAQADPAIKALMIVGHNPGLHEFAISLLDQRRAANPDQERLLSSFPTTSAAVFAFDDQGHGVFERQWTPRDVGGGAL
jgi:phosphohistidine phosphatase